MHAVVEFLVHHGYTVLFWWVLAEQIGLPIPSLPMLLAAGAMSAWGDLNFAAVLVVACVAALLADFIWFHLGSWQGVRVLGTLCRISIEPDSCVRRTENIFQRYGAPSLLIAKFLPGFSTIAPPMAGVSRMKRWTFLIFDGLGAAIWAGSFVVLGFLFSNQIEELAERALKLGGRLAFILALLLAGWILFKYIQRVRFQRQLRRVIRISPQELRRRLDGGEPLTILDLRHALDFLAYPQVIPGALRFDPDKLDENIQQIPRDRAIILYCT
ncbi:MAG TPA: VTT domain-containing protein [Terriglobales bacterium]|nr:VTT domain-containing protein [Terriglobales bacterium]